MCELALRCGSYRARRKKVPEITYGGDGRKREKVNLNTVEVNAVTGGDQFPSDRAILDQRVAVEKILAEARADAERIKTMMQLQLAAQASSLPPTFYGQSPPSNDPVPDWTTDSIANNPGYAASGNQIHGFQPDPSQYSNPIRTPIKSPYQHPYPNHVQNQYPPQGRGEEVTNRGQGVWVARLFLLWKGGTYKERLSSSH